MPEQAAPSPPPPGTDAAKVENFLLNRVDPQWGHGVPFQSDERTKTSLSRSHASQ